jgi:hypothetical protein
VVSLLIILGGAASLVTRFRHARGVERQQLRWVTLAAALTGVAMLATGVLVAVGDLALAGWASVIGTVFLPLAAGAAILRYRLYDLDRIISRTLAYGLLTVLLGGGYALVALVLGQLLGRDSSLVVAAATLAVAAVFQPARRRVQAAVDRRFNRRRHDAAGIIEGFGTRLRDQVDLDTLTAELLAVAAVFQPARRRVQAAVDRRFNRRRHDAAGIIEGFGTRLRDQVDLDTLTAELLAVVDQTMQPTQAWLWQRPPPARAGR